MQEQKKSYQFSTGLIVGVSSVIIIAGGLGAWWAWTAIKGEQAPSWVPEQLKREPSTEEEPNPSPQEIEAQVYWLKVTDNEIELAATPMVMEKAEESVAVKKALTELFSGTDQENYASSIPEAAQLRSVSLREDGIHVDLSEEFTFGGGSTAMMGRLGQVLYTATSLNPDAKVWLEVEGEPLEYLGGEGLYIPQPLTRDEFQANYSLK